MSTILLVDDEKILRTLLRFALERRGQCVIEASSAGRAISLSSRHREPIDLLVAAISLPGRGGLGLFESLRAERPAMQALLLSRAPHQQALLEEAQASGNEVMAEPFEIGDLLDSIDAALVSSRRRRPPARSRLTRKTGARPVKAGSHSRR